VSQVGNLRYSRLPVCATEQSRFMAPMRDAVIVVAFHEPMVNRMQNFVAPATKFCIQQFMVLMRVSENVETPQQVKWIALYSNIPWCATGRAAREPAA